MNKKRTIVTIIGVILSCALMVGIGLLFSSFRDYVMENVKKSSGSQHVIYKELDHSKQEIIKSSKGIKDSFYSQTLGYASISNVYNPYLLVVGGSDEYLNTINLIAGRLPQNDHEIIIREYITNQDGETIKIGDEITLNIGTRTLNGTPVEEEEYYTEGETIENAVTKTYKVVGTMTNSIYEDYRLPASYAITKIDQLDTKKMIDYYVTFKKEKDIVKQGNVLAKNLGLSVSDEIENSQIDYNYNLLSFYGESNYGNFNNGMSMIISIILLLISVGCTIVIYNSFAISVMERKKQFGLFSSIGTTKKQLRQTVFFEAIIIGLIGIPIGILSGFIGIGSVISIMESLAPELFGNLHLVVYPLFLIIPIIFMIVVILTSAFIPAKLASRVSPISAIRQNDDIKINSKKVKSNRLIKKIFGIEGDLAMKNIKRNKKKYRITVISIFISIVLFVSFSAFLQYGIMSSVDYIGTPETDIVINFEDQEKEKIEPVVNKLKAVSGVDDFTYLNIIQSLNSSITYSNFTENAKNYIREEQWLQYNTIRIITLGNEEYQKYIKRLGINQDQIILINKIVGISYKDGNRVAYNIPYLKEKPKEINLCKLEYGEEYYDEETGYYQTDLKNENCHTTLNNIYMTEELPFGVKDLLDNTRISLIMSEKQVKELQLEQKEKDLFPTSYLLLKSKKASEMDESLETILKDSEIGYHYENIAKDMQLMKNMVIIIQILLYGFISLITLIGVTSVFNTINTSIALRRREFAMLRSMGLTPKGFNKMIIFESIFFGLKSLLYGLPVGCAISYLFYRSFSNFSNYDHFTLPWNSIIITIVAVFIIVYMTMMYATKKVKKDNILEAIREENI